MTSENTSYIYNVKQNLRLSLLEGAFAHVYANLTGGIFLPAFVLLLGANSFEIGILAAIPFLATLAQLYGSLLVERSHSRKKPTVRFVVLSRLLWLPVIAAIYIFEESNPDSLLKIFIILFLCLHILASISGVSWLSWMSSLVPEGIRGRFFGLRNSILGIITIIVTISGGLFLDWYKFTFSSPLTFAFLILFATAFISSLISSIFLNRKSEPESHIPSSQPIKLLFKDALNNNNFRPMLLFALVWAFAVNFAAPFFVVYQLQELHFSYTLISIVTIASALSDLAGMGFWGHLTDQHGNRPIMLICASFGSLMPLIWLSTTAHEFSRFIWIPVLHLMGGFIFSGYTLSSVNMVFGVVPRKNNSVYFALWNSINGVATALGAICGGLFYDHGSMILAYLPFDMEWSFKFVFLFSGILRLFALLFMRRVREQSTPVLKMVRILRNMRTWATTMGFHPLLQFFLPATPANENSPHWPIWKEKRTKS